MKIIVDLDRVKTTFFCNLGATISEISSSNNRFSK